MAAPVVAIVGRPNVGKSTLFNRLAGRRIAITSEEPGTTRDRVSFDAEWAGYRFVLIDTGGIEQKTDAQGLNSAIQQQRARALEEADAAVLVVDVIGGITSGDRDAADVVRRSGRPVVLAANKADNDARAQGAVEFHELGLGEPVAISAYHGDGIAELMETLLALVPEAGEPDAPDGIVRIAIAGRPNVGKSALLNAITGSERAIVSETPGTTRDPVDSRYSYAGREILFVDTAGLRRRGKAEPGIEKYSALRSIRAIERAHVVLVLLDASEFVTAQDTHVAGFVEDASRGAVIVVNKWDLAEGRELAGGIILDEDRAAREVRDRLKFLEGAPVRFTTATLGTGVEKVLDSALAVYDQWTRYVDGGELKRAVLDAMARHPPPSGRRRDIRLYSVNQPRSAPPTFVFRVSEPERLHFSYRRYLENRLRAEFGFEGAPLKLEFRRRR